MTTMSPWPAHAGRLAWRYGGLRAAHLQLEHVLRVVPAVTAETR
jgi:hypothetical protein